MKNSRLRYFSVFQLFTYILNNCCIKLIQIIQLLNCHPTIIFYVNDNIMHALEKIFMLGTLKILAFYSPQYTFFNLLPNIVEEK